MHTEPHPRPGGETLLLLHSSAAGGQQWRRHAALLPAARVHAPDLLGYGDDAPPWPSGAARSLDDEAERLAPWLLGQPAPVHVVGHSYGGAVALQLALRWPAHVARLTLYEPVRFALLREGLDPLWPGIEAVGRGIVALCAAGRAQDAGERFVDYWSGEGSWGAMSTARRAAIALRMPKVCAEFEALFADPVPLTAWARLALPVLLLHGTRSPRPTQRIAQRLALLLRGARLQAMPWLGHMGPLEDPARFVRLLGGKAAEAAEAAARAA